MIQASIQLQLCSNLSWQYQTGGLGPSMGISIACSPHWECDQVA